MPRGVPATTPEERRELNRARYKRWADKNRDHLNARQRAYFAGSPEQREKRLERSRAYYAANRDRLVAANRVRRAALDPDYRRERQWRTNLVAKFGITEADYNEMLAAQDGVCAVCLFPESITDKASGRVRRLAVDHCHSTGKVRGLLCHKCNLGLAKFREDPAIFARAVAYLDSNSDQFIT